MSRVSLFSPTLAQMIPVVIVMMSGLCAVKVYGVVTYAFQSGSGENAGLFMNAALAAPQAEDKTRADPAASLGLKDRCAHEDACQGRKQLDTDLPPDAAGKDMLSDISRRLKDLDQREQEISSQKTMLKSAMQAWQQKMKGQSAPDTETHLSGEDAERLVAIYEAMKPEDAAAVFNVLDLRVCVALLEKMSPRHASAIMGAMSPQRTILATQFLAKRHVLTAMETPDDK